MGTDNRPPELSSMAASLEDVGRRVTAMAEEASGTAQDWVAQELYEVERSVAEAVRRLSSLQRTLRKD